MRGRVRLSLAAVALACLVPAAPAAAGQIVYSHGGDLWAMNDDGSGQRPLASAAQIGGAIDAGSTADPQPVSVQPGGTGVAFVAPPGGSCVAQQSNCPALYSLVDGRLVRLTAPSAPCGSVSVQCASEEEDPAVTADGRLVYDRLDTASAFICPFYCGYSEAYYSRRLDGSDAPVPWPVPQQSSDPEGEDPGFEGSIAADPADASKLAYQGNAVNGGGQTLYPVDVDSAGNPPSVNAAAYDDSFLYGLAFSGDGSLLADIETGGEKGIWVYPSGQDADAGDAEFYWALEDPDNGQGTSLDHFLSGLAFVGGSALVFSADYNLYSLPARCWATPAGAGVQPNCHFPQDATRLTSDGTATAPDTSPAWTSSTTPIAAIGTTGGGATGGGATAPTPSTRGGRPAARPSGSHAGLRGVRSGRPQLSFDLAAGGGGALKRILVKLPRGLHFAHSARALRRGISLRAGAHRLAFGAKLAGGALSILLRKPAKKLELRFGYPAIRVSKALAAKVAKGKAGKLRIAVRVTDVAGAATHLALPVKPR